MKSDEKQLIESSKNGNLSAFEELMKPFQGRIYNFLKKMCNQGETAEDMMQETFVSVWKSIGTYREEAKFSTWLFQIASNHCLMQKRKDSRRPQVSLDVTIHPDFSADPSVVYDKNDLKQKLDAALARLPESYRVVYVLKDVEGFRSQEIADMLGLSLPNVKARVLRARQKLQVALKGG